MADVVGQKAPTPVGILGLNSSGVPTNFAGVDANQNVQAKDVIQTSASTLVTTIGTTSAEAKVGGSTLANRKLLEITPTSGTIYYSFTSPATTTATPIYKGTTARFAMSLPVYIIASAASQGVVISEGA